MIWIPVFGVYISSLLNSIGLINFLMLNFYYLLTIFLVGGLNFCKRFFLFDFLLDFYFGDLEHELNWLSSALLLQNEFGETY